MSERKKETPGVKIEENKKVYENENDPRKRSKIINNHYALAPVINFEYCAGIFRYYLYNGKLRSPKWFMKCYCVFVATTIVTLFSMFIKIPTAIIGDENLINVIDEIPSIVILLQYVTTMIVTSFFLCARNKEVITKFAELDEQLLETDKDDFYKKARSRNKKYLIALTLSQTFFGIIDMISEDKFIVSQLVVLPVYLIQKLEILMFCIFIGMLNRRLTIINCYIAKFLEERDNNKTSVYTLCDSKAALHENNSIIGRPSESNRKIRDLAVIYDKIGTICQLMNHVFNFQIFMCLVSTFTHIIITIWTSLYYFRSTEINSGPLITIIILCISTILVVAVMCFVCERLRSVRNSTKILVNQIIMDYDLPKSMRVQAKAFMELIEAWPLRVFIYDMFSVDITLMLKFVSVATTYLIVIIQLTHFI